MLRIKHLGSKCEERSNNIMAKQLIAQYITPITTIVR